MGEISFGIGESFAPIVWVEFESSDGSTRAWSAVPLPDPSSYYSGEKQARLAGYPLVQRALSDDEGVYTAQTFQVTVIDSDFYLRSLLGAPDYRRLIVNKRLVMRMISVEDWRAQLTPRTVAIGKIRNYTAEPVKQDGT